MNSQSEFYVGYLPIPPGLRKHLRQGASPLWELLPWRSRRSCSSSGRAPFAASAFEFHDYRDFQGVLLAEPYPALVVPGGSPWLLVGAGQARLRAAARGRRPYGPAARRADLPRRGPHDRSRSGSVADTGEPADALATSISAPRSSRARSWTASATSA